MQLENLFLQPSLRRVSVTQVGFAYFGDLGNVHEQPQLTHFKINGMSCSDMLQECTELISLKTIQNEALNIHEREMMFLALRKYSHELMTQNSKVSCLPNHDVDVQSAIAVVKNLISEDVCEQITYAVKCTKEALLLEDLKFEAKVDYYRFVGECFFVLAIFSTGTESRRYGEDARSFFERGRNLSTSMVKAHPCYLELQMTYAALMFDVFGRKEACEELLLITIEDAKSNIDGLAEEKRRHAKGLIVQLQEHYKYAAGSECGQNIVLYGMLA